MKKIDTITKGLTGFLRTFKKIIEDIDKEKEIKKIVFTGNAYTCTPIVELLSYVIRDMNKELIFIPSLDLGKPYKVNISEVDFDFVEGGDPKNPDLLVIMGGLAMKGGPDVEKVIKFMEDLGEADKKTLGVCFMSVFERAGWVGVVPFDFLIDIKMEGALYGR